MLLKSLLLALSENTIAMITFRQQDENHALCLCHKWFEKKPAFGEYLFLKVNLRQRNGNKM